MTATKDFDLTISRAELNELAPALLECLKGMVETGLCRQSNTFDRKCLAESLGEQAKAALERFPQLKLNHCGAKTIVQDGPAKARVLVTVEGGCAYIAEQGDVETLLVDYDNGDELPAEWESLTPLGTDIPTGKQDHTAESLPGHTPEEFCEYLTSTLIPDLRESGRDATADDFQTCVRMINGHWDVICELTAVLGRYVELHRDAVVAVARANATA